VILSIKTLYKKQTTFSRLSRKTDDSNYIQCAGFKSEHENVVSLIIFKG
jgi:hypothetical protein